jgi:hypothetical protein
LDRLPPRTSRAPDPRFPWIIIANPYEKQPRKSGDLGKEFNAEGPTYPDGNSAEFQQRGNKLLEDLKSAKSEIELAYRGKSKAIINREVSKEVKKVIQEILDTAADLRCTSGKVISPYLFHTSPFSPLFLFFLFHS